MWDKYPHFHQSSSGGPQSVTRRIITGLLSDQSLTVQIPDWPQSGPNRIEIVSSLTGELDSAVTLDPERAAWLIGVLAKWLATRTL